MPSLGFGEILVILVIALIFLGPQRLPEVGKAIGRAMREFRKAADEISREFANPLQEADRPKERPRDPRRRRSEPEVIRDPDEPVPPDPGAGKEDGTRAGRSAKAQAGEAAGEAGGLEAQEAPETREKKAGVDEAEAGETGLVWEVPPQEPAGDEKSRE